MRALRDQWLQAAHAKKVLAQPDHPHWMSAAKFVHEAVEGKPKQSMNLGTGGVPLEILLSRSWEESKDEDEE